MTTGVNDVVWHHAAKGEAQIWPMDGHRIVQRVTVWWMRRVGRSWSGCHIRVGGCGRIPEKPWPTGCLTGWSCRRWP